MGCSSTGSRPALYILTRQGKVSLQKAQIAVAHEQAQAVQVAACLTPSS